MKTLRETFGNDLSELGITIPEILMPDQKIDLSTWAVIACDQYTSDQAYWNSVESLCKKEASTLHITLPEIYLKAHDLQARIKAIHSTMEQYDQKGIMRSLGEGLMYIERHTHSGLRQGLLTAFDLEHYDFSPDSKTLIRATEGTIIDRIPPRLAVRAQASMEVPHIMILIDDPACTVIENIKAALKNAKPEYAIELMKNGGTVQGWFLQSETLIAPVLSALKSLKTESSKRQNSSTPLLFAMGDGNHSLATAKVSWNNIKQKLLDEGSSLDEVMLHPARFALAELVNIHSSGLRFEPIHRTIFCAAPQSYTRLLSAMDEIETIKTVSEPEIVAALSHKDLGQRTMGVFDGQQWLQLTLKSSCALLPPAIADQAFSLLQKTDNEAEIDFIHGWQDACQLAGPKAVSVLLPVIARDMLFSRVQSFGPLPRKAFSMGEAEEKRYYVEARKITRN